MGALGFKNLVDKMSKVYSTHVPFNKHTTYCLSACSASSPVVPSRNMTQMPLPEHRRSNFYLDTANVSSQA